jgi:predicted ribosomally synthesized peptide with nif11-like leader
MTSDSLRQLKSLAQTDEELRVALGAATSREDVVGIASQYGIEIDVSDLDGDVELSTADVDDADLESMAGGWHPKYSTFTDSCI